ncbi:MAG: hypothetical protein ACFFD5_07605 [Candidatus Thorarchaeota archaeon]
MIEFQDLTEEINKLVEGIKKEIYSSNVSLLDLELRPIFQKLEETLSIYNIENYAETYRDACKLLNQKFEELKILLSSIDNKKKFYEYIKSEPDDEEISQLMKDCWRETFIIDSISLNFLDYIKERFLKLKKTPIKIEHLNKASKQGDFLLEIPKQSFTERMINYFVIIKEKLPCKFHEVFEEESDQIKVFENFVFILHLLQLGKIKYQKETETLYI